MRQRRGSPFPAAPPPPAAHLEMLLEANGQYLSHGWGRAPQGRDAGRGPAAAAGQAPLHPTRQRGGGEGRRGEGEGEVAQAQSPRWDSAPAGSPPSPASARGRSLRGGITPHVTSLPGSPQIVPLRGPSSPASRPPLPPAAPPPPLPPAPAEWQGWAGGSEEPGGSRQPGCGQ